MPPAPERPEPGPLPEAGQTLPQDGRRAFLRTMSHELRTPLNAIIGFSEILSAELYGPLGATQYREYAGIIQESGQKLLRLVNDILEIARLEGGAAEILAREEALRPAIDQAVLATRLEAAAGDLRVTVEGAEALPAVLADGRGLRTIFFNLLQRAVAVSPPHSEVRVRAWCEEGRVFAEVRDAAGSMEPQAAAALLNPTEPAAEDGAGCDLALPIAAMLIEALGGSLELRPCEDGLAVTVGFRAAEAAAGPLLLRA